MFQLLIWEPVLRFRKHDLEVFILYFTCCYCLKYSDENFQTMAWILDEYSKFHGYSPAVVTGKPIVSKE